MSLLFFAQDMLILHLKQLSSFWGVLYKPFLESYWLINYDHLVNVGAEVGDEIVAGDYIGNPAIDDPEIPTALVEIQLYRDGYSYPLVPYFSPDLKQEYEDKIMNLMNDWEGFKGSSGIYDEAAMANFCPGCLDSRIKDVDEYS